MQPRLHPSSRPAHHRQPDGCTPGITSRPDLPKQVPDDEPGLLAETDPALDAHLYMVGWSDATAHAQLQAAAAIEETAAAPPIRDGTAFYRMGKQFSSVNLVPMA